MLLVLLCAGCGHMSASAGTAVVFAAAAATAQLLAPPALEGRSGICPESREIRCVTTALCAHDDRLGCDFCRCAALLRGTLVIAPGGATTTGDVAIDLSLPASPWVPPPR